MTRNDRVKALGALLLHRSGALALADRARATQSVTIVNYHATPASLRGPLARQFDWYRDRFESLDEAGLAAFLDGSRRLTRPGIVITFDDGYDSNATVAAPLLAARGLHGWFFVPGGFLDEAAERQAAFSLERIREEPNAEHPDLAALRAMSWQAARELADAGHVLGCHTWDHVCLGPRPAPEVIEREVVAARRRLEERLDRPVRSFCWVRGRLQDYSRVADLAVRATYDFAFMTFGEVVRPGDDPLALQRFNVEASCSLPLTRFLVSPLNARLFASRRRKLASILGSA